MKELLIVLIIVILTVSTEHMVTGEQLPNSLNFKEAKKFITLYGNTGAT